MIFVLWLDDHGVSWTNADLAAYRDYLLTTYKGKTGKPLSAVSVAAHLSTVRGQYRAIVRDASSADKKAFVDKTLIRLQNIIDPDAVPVKVIKERDIEDGKHLRLTVSQANALLRSPFEHPQNTALNALRDAAMITLMLCTGIREAELIALNTEDLRTTFGGALALRVQQGKGMVARSIPYGELDFCLPVVDRWLEMAGITSGAVFRGFYHGAKVVKANRLSLRAVLDIIGKYPVIIDGKQVKVRPHDLRRTYARRLHDAGVKLLAIQQNLGHKNHVTTEGYIGTLDASDRQPTAIYTFDFTLLNVLNRRDG